MFAILAQASLGIRLHNNIVFLLLFYYSSTGILTHFTIMLNCNFWFLHVLHLFLNVLFPLKFSLLKDKRWEKRLHIIEVIASIGFASLGPAVVWLSNNDYNTFTRPPLLCIPTPNSMLLYTLCLPILFLLIIGVNLIATIVWALLKVSHSIYIYAFFL